MKLVEKKENGKNDCTFERVRVSVFFFFFFFSFEVFLSLRTNTTNVDKMARINSTMKRKIINQDSKSSSNISSSIVSIERTNMGPRTNPPLYLPTSPPSTHPSALFQSHSLSLALSHCIYLSISSFLPFARKMLTLLPTIRLWYTNFELRLS